MQTNLKYRVELLRPASDEFYSETREIQYPHSLKNGWVSPNENFRLLIDDRILEVNGQVLIFKKYLFTFDGFRHDEYKIMILKTTDDKIVILTREGPSSEPKFHLFSCHGVSVFTRVYQILVPDLNYYIRNYDFHLVVCYNSSVLYDAVHNFGMFRRISKIFRFNTTHNGENIKDVIEELSEEFNIEDIFGPFPLDLSSKKFDSRFLYGAMWLALCSDDKYRFFYTDNEHYKLTWITDLDGSILALKTVLPTLKPNYYYLLTENNRELIIQSFHETNQQDDFSEALQTDVSRRRLFVGEEGFYKKISFLLGQNHDQGFVYLRNQEPQNERLPTISDFTEHLVEKEF